MHAIRIFFFLVQRRFTGQNQQNPHLVITYKGKFKNEIDATIVLKFYGKTKNNFWKNLA